MVAKLLRAPVVVLATLILLSGCTLESGLPSTPTKGPTDQPLASSTATPKSSSNANENNAQALLSESVRALAQAESYSFSIAATLRTKFEDKPREWNFTGAGAAANPDKIQWTMEGQADTFLRVVGVGKASVCNDTRGEAPDCSLAFGGPKPGSSPYTVIAYLQNFGTAGKITTRSLQGKEYFHVTFSPALQKVAALDPAHAKALATVAAVEAEVWIDKSTKLPFIEKALVTYKPTSSGEESVEIALTFEEFNQAVDIKLPR